MPLIKDILQYHDLLSKGEQKTSLEPSQDSQLLSEISGEIQATTNTLDTFMRSLQTHCIQWNSTSGNVCKEKLDLPTIAIGKSNADKLVSIKKLGDDLFKSYVEGEQANISGYKLDNIKTNLDKIQDNFYSTNGFITSTNKTEFNCRQLIANLKRIKLDSLKPTDCECLENGSEITQISSFGDKNGIIATSSPLSNRLKVPQILVNSFQMEYSSEED